MSDLDTMFGFQWGPVEVQRISAVERTNGCYRVLRVAAEHGPALDLYISPSGRSIRVFRNGVELKEPNP